MTMKETRLLMGMPITLEVIDAEVTQKHLDEVFAYFVAVDQMFSTYKATSEISRINNGKLSLEHASQDVRTILTLGEQTQKETNGYFNIYHNGMCDPSGIVKGWAISNAANLLKEQGFLNYYIDAGGDVQISGKKNGQMWRVGIRNPFNRNEVVKVLALSDRGIATSGTAIRGQHIYNPHDYDTPIRDIMSITVIGPDIYDADRFATAAFAMGRQGIGFIESLDGFEGYLIDTSARATFTSGFERYVLAL